MRRFSSDDNGFSFRDSRYACVRCSENERLLLSIQCLKSRVRVNERDANEGGLWSSLHAIEMAKGLVDAVLDGVENDGLDLWQKLQPIRL
ncbi:hypothetical protein [Pseudomonas sp. 6D_7.1_Bac1]|jgi:hypothetical protein|uniref:hypothetical protein n=1 Tax=Pseudomonas sp. 6D_7.1_Bac1 TaxID=2971615 RepID=UPI0021C77D09|nr:hypothetical protein [Pseudomonas sp. 6D_7.1_Bac1]MCU1752750.1 hypothetical protein [Pseudomonas sp. 6D_7.1_Bac1]